MLCCPLRHVAHSTHSMCSTGQVQPTHISHTLHAAVILPASLRLPSCSTTLNLHSGPRTLSCAGPDLQAALPHSSFLLSCEIHCTRAARLHSVHQLSSHADAACSHDLLFQTRG